MAKEDARKWRDVGDVGAVGIEFVVALALGYYAGKWLDHRYFHDRGYATAIGALLGVFTAFKAIWDAAKRAQRRLEELDRDERREAEERDASQAAMRPRPRGLPPPPAEDEDERGAR
jgi:F0F1-type ATP synthase assembly protein I